MTQNNFGAMRFVCYNASRHVLSHCDYIEPNELKVGAARQKIMSMLKELPESSSQSDSDHSIIGSKATSKNRNLPLLSALATYPATPHKKAVPKKAAVLDMQRLFATVNQPGYLNGVGMHMIGTTCQLAADLDECNREEWFAQEANARVESIEFTEPADSFL